MDITKGKKTIDLKRAILPAAPDKQLLASPDSQVIKTAGGLSELKIESRKAEASISSHEKDRKDQQIEELFGEMPAGGEDQKIFEQAKRLFDFELCADSKKRFLRWGMILSSALIVLVVVVVSFRIVHRTDSGGQWYAVKLVNGEMYFGKTSDITADPIVLSNVFVNYGANGETAQTSSLQLIKRGKETYGPSGTMNIIRSQAVYLEPLQADSPVLQAIMNYEKK